MVNKLRRKRAKEIQNKIDELRMSLKKTEIRPCQGDVDLKEREKDITALKSEIRSLENERDKYLYSWWEKA